MPSVYRLQKDRCDQAEAASIAAIPSATHRMTWLLRHYLLRSAKAANTKPAEPEWRLTSVPK